MKRRDFLKVASNTAMLTALAGCSGGDNLTLDKSNQSENSGSSGSPGDNANTSSGGTNTPTTLIDTIEAARLPPATPSEPLGQPLQAQTSIVLTNNSANALLFQHGVASGDPLPNRVVLWTRLTIPNKGNSNKYNRYDEHLFYWGAPYKNYRASFIADVTKPVFETIDASADYTIQVVWEVATDANMVNIVAHGFTKAKKSRDFTVKVDPILPNPNTTYYYRFRALGWVSPTGRTKTTPAFNEALSRAKFALFSCSDHESGHFNAYANIAKEQDIDAVIHVGDYIYETGYKLGIGDRGHPYDNDLLSKPSKLTAFRGRFSQYRIDPDLQECHRQHPFIVVWDDHEFHDNFYTDNSNTTWQNIKKNAAQAYEEWMPIRKVINPEDADEFLLYRSFSYGKLLSLSMLDSRRYRSKPNANLANDPNRTMLGAKQQSWLNEELKRHHTRGCKWNVLGQQLIFSPSKGGGKGADEGYGDDIWNGYAHNRKLILDTVKDNNIQNFVVLSGDWHTGMAFDIVTTPFTQNTYNPTTGAGSLGVEIVSPAVSSGVYKDGGSTNAKLSNPHIRFHDDTHNGYVILEFTPEYCQSDFKLLNSLKKDDGTVTSISLRTQSGKNHLTQHGQLIAVNIQTTPLVSDAVKSPMFA